ncbi:uncharacterized protein LOC115411935 isoform X2 [Sphaeramia orbicularis]|uniref:uncharacterized protein LOC115411935 isoform X2 n=1 Tax=Sphaeramia orbicularis TaxID=375764 RepID=UPI0011809B88|nr:uncharacterized protein LOC115411935 isoform X2 [Sphaeramia orbicularis]
MVKFQSISFFLMVLTFRMNRAFLLLIHLLSFNIFADSSDVSNVQVFRGQSITFSCNKSTGKLFQVDWNNSRYMYAHDTERNDTTSNFTHHRFNIDTNFSNSTLTIIKAEDEDAGLYSCTLSGKRGTEVFTWNLTVTENPKGKELSGSWHLYILPPLSGLLLLGFSLFICLCLELKNRSSNQESVQNRMLCPDKQSTYTEVEFGTKAYLLSFQFGTRAGCCP